MKSEEEILKETSEFVKKTVKMYDSGHGWSHIDRVVRLALLICEREEKGDRFTIELGALLHDIGDHKFALHDGPAEIRNLLNDLGVSDNVIEEVVNINENISFSKGRIKTVMTDELQIVQDADRLDAMGAVGIARAFNYGGYKGDDIYDPDKELIFRSGSEPVKKASLSTIHHFYDKLLLLKDLMNTSTGRKLAEERHAFMVSYLEQFFKEWNSGVNL